MKSKSILLLLFGLILITSAINVNAGLFSKDKSVYMQLNNSVYYLPINDQNSNIPLEIFSEFDDPVEAILKISMTQTINRQGFHSSQSNSQSKKLSINDEYSVWPIILSSREETEFDFTFTLSYYNEDKEENVKTILKTKVYFVDPKNEDNKQNQDQESQSSKNKDPQKSQDQKSSSTNNQNSQNQDQASKTNQKLQDSQNTQNTNSLKDQMKKQEQERIQKEKEFKDNLMKNDDFREQHEKLEKEGYKLDNISSNMNSSKDGDFKANYKKQNGDSAQLKGDMTNSSVDNLAKQTSEDKKEMLDSLNNNSNFQKLQNDLQKNGFNLSNQEFGDFTNKTSQMTLEYKNNQTNETVLVEVDFENNNVEKIKHDYKKSKTYLFYLALMIIGILMYFYANNIKVPVEELDEVKQSKRRFNYKTWCKKNLAKSKQEYDNENIKNAYSLLSKVLRTYLSYKYSDGHELLYSDAKVLSEENNFHSKKVAEILDSCEFVIFAGYSDNDFDNFHKFLRDNLFE